MLTAEKIFKSPQTGSEYVKVTEGYEDLFVAVRAIGHDDDINKEAYRITIRGDEQSLRNIVEDLSGVWSEIKDCDHISVVTDQDTLVKLVNEAVMAIEDHVYNPTWFNDVVGKEYAVDVARVLCPHCGCRFNA